MKNISISLVRQPYQYQVFIGQGILNGALADLILHHPEPVVFVVTNDRVNALYPDRIAKALPAGFTAKLLVLPDGERYKTLDTLSLIFDFLAKEGANRKSLLVAFGGGVIGDMVGFAAASYMRGMSFVQVPTTLLSQVDSSIGGKTAVNHPSGKNSIGAFKQPLQTIIDVDFLATLPPREFLAGYAELVKHGFIADSYLYQLLHKTTLEALSQNAPMLIEAISRSCQVKANVVEKDERESFARAMLNFGHTLGHFIETYTNYDQYLHGEAVIAGMDFAAFWSVRRGLLSPSDYKLIGQHLAQLGLKITYPKVNQSTFFEIIGHDKKSSAQGLNFIGLNSLGQGVIVAQVQLKEIWETYQAYLVSEGALIQETVP
ncbi:MAG: 3-dehydroquinate synthase [Candidatus Lambdaproteobacteria bacterium RIFOXYD2_FULL_50_16]|uniref:3-dehydroquinate synthase n=1 Tax=Candidatus Lambdaproteobacteria bacterium RIFOXYD2_FULL_50_16 TaxID=1817772 RepID=A0A1F6GFM3_9PROT|nr:MAG: 3-dehydroquinate synthase [Candidatus Lambdaproteobacteria bacterium RIFOXYD2_FULL_50_16]